MENDLEPRNGYNARRRCVYEQENEAVPRGFGGGIRYMRRMLWLDAHFLWEAHFIFKCQGFVRCAFAERFQPNAPWLGDGASRILGGSARSGARVRSSNGARGYHSLGSPPKGSGHQ